MLPRGRKRVKRGGEDNFFRIILRGQGKGVEHADSFGRGRGRKLMRKAKQFLLVAGGGKIYLVLYLCLWRDGEKDIILTNGGG